MNRLTIRAATAADLPFIVAIGIADSVTPLDDDPDAAEPDYAEALAAIDGDPNQELYVAEYEGERTGTFQLSFAPGIMRRGMWRGTIEAVHIVPEHRSLGLGSEMMRWAIERCRERGSGVVQLTSSKKRVDAHRFYQRLGFAQSHEGFKLYL